MKQVEKLFSFFVCALCIIIHVDALYSPYEAEQYVWLSAAAYCHSNTLKTWECGLPCKHLGVHKNSVAIAYNAKYNVQAYVVKTNQNEVIISFRGTNPNSIKDWVDDLKFKKIAPYPKCSACHVHTGFYDAYMSLQGQIIKGLQQLKAGPGSIIHVTGHSLGGAMASLCAFDLSTKGYKIGQSYTFGEPRVGDSVYASALEANIGKGTIYRVVHNRDIVPHLPLQLMGFHHESTEVWYTESSNKYKVCNGSGEDPKCSDSLTIAISISDHLNYLDIPISGSCLVNSFNPNPIDSPKSGNLRRSSF